jgi:hypothetical protein
MVMLAISTLTVYSMEVVFNSGNRFQVLFTIVLTIVANKIVIDGNLPKLPYTTWVDGFLFRITLFVYFIIVETGVAAALGNGWALGDPPANYNSTKPYDTTIADYVRVWWGLTGRGSNLPSPPMYQVDTIGFWIAVAMITTICAQGMLSGWYLTRKRSLAARRIEGQARNSIFAEEARLDSLGYVFLMLHGASYSLPTGIRWALGTNSNMTRWCILAR